MDSLELNLEHSCPEHSDSSLQILFASIHSHLQLHPRSPPTRRFQGHLPAVHGSSCPRRSCFCSLTAGSSFRTTGRHLPIGRGQKASTGEILCLTFCFPQGAGGKTCSHFCTSPFPVKTTKTIRTTIKGECILYRFIKLCFEK